MSLDKDRLGSAIWTTIKAQESYSPAISPSQDAAGLALWKSIAKEILDEIKNNAVVDSTGADAQTGTVTSTGTVS